MITVNVKKVEGERVIAEVYGLSTDTKPTTYGINKFYNGSVFIEMDTQKFVFYDQEADEWIEEEKGE